MDKKAFANMPLPTEPKQLVRASINGITDNIADLKSAVDSMDLNEHLKAYIASELDEITTNAAEILLHDIERPYGGFDLHICVKAVSLGAAAESVFVRGS
jgi:hypothetical protein